MQNSFDFVLALPEILLLILAAGVLLFDAFNKSEGRHSTFALSQLSLVIVGLVIFWQWANGIMGTSFGGLFRVDALALFVKLLSVIAVIVTLLYGRQYAEDRGMLVRGGELYTLTMFALLGQFLMISASHLLMVYLGVELLSFSLYALVALRRENAKVTEAAMKYFILGALASGVMLYGLSMVYGATGSLHLNTIGQTIASGEVLRLPLVFGVVFIVSGLAFKLTAAPFHMWTPDVYEGAPTTVTLIIAAAPKLAAFVIALRVVTDALHGIAIDWQPMLMVLAVLSLLVGNLTALVQTNFKRLLAYSTISHMGFVFLGLLSGVDVAIAEDPNSLAAMIQRMLGYDYAVAAYAYGAALYYVIIYVLTTLITFGIILVLSRKGFECENISDFRGLNRRHPLLAFFLLLSMFSLAGIPPLAGFYAKLSILESLIHAGHLGLAVYAVIMSLIGAFYYIRVVKVAYFEEPDTETPSSPVGLGLITKWVLGINGLLLIVLGIVPGGLMDISIRAVQSSLNFF